MNPRQGLYQPGSRLLSPAFLLALYCVAFSSAVSHAGQPGGRLDTQPAAGAPGAIKDAGPPFSYDLYCNEQGLFTYDGQAWALAKRPEHLRRVYVDAAQAQPRARILVRELEKVFHDLGISVAEKTTKPGCLLLPEVTPECGLDWQALSDFLGSTTEAQHLRGVTIHAYEVEARKRGVQNAVIVETGKLLGALGVAAAASKAAVVPARPPAASVAVERAAPLQSAAGGGAKELSAEAQRGIRSLEKRLADFKANPTVRPGMEGQPKEVIEAAQQSRIRHLEKEIQTFQENIKKLPGGE